MPFLDSCKRYEKKSRFVGKGGGSVIVASLNDLCVDIGLGLMGMVLK